MSWSTNAVIQPFESYRWRFLGDSPNLSLYFLSLLPDPYLLARRNTYVWTASYLDTKDGDSITINNMPGKIKLTDLKELGPGETETVTISRQFKDVASLQDMTSDCLATNYSLTDEQLHTLGLPRSLQHNLGALMRDYDEMKNNQMLPCPKCKEKHH